MAQADRIHELLEKLEQRVVQPSLPLAQENFAKENSHLKSQIDKQKREIEQLKTTLAKVSERLDLSLALVERWQRESADKAA